MLQVLMDLDTSYIYILYLYMITSLYNLAYIYTCNYIILHIYIYTHVIIYIYLIYPFLGRSNNFTQTEMTLTLETDGLMQ